MKRFLKSSLSLLLAITIIFSSAYVGLSEVDFGSLFTVEAKAADIQASGQCGTNVFWELDSKGNLTISGTGAMTSHPWWEDTESYWLVWYPVYKYKINSVTIEDGVTSICDFAFRWATSLKTIALSNTVTDIGVCAFQYTTGVSQEQLIIPKSIKKISGGAFGNCNVGSIVIANPNCTIVDRGFLSGQEGDNITSGTYYNNYRGNIYGYENSTAHEYCQKYGATFLSLGYIDYIYDWEETYNLPEIIVPDTYTINIKALSDEEDENGDKIKVPAEGADVTVYLGKEDDASVVCSKKSDASGNVVFSKDELLSKGISPDDVANCTVSAHFQLGNDFELCSEVIDSNGVWRGVPLANGLSLTVDEPRWKPSLSVLINESDLGKCEEVINNYSKEFAQSTNGHVIINDFELMIAPDEYFFKSKGELEEITINNDIDICMVRNSDTQPDSTIDWVSTKQGDLDNTIAGYELNSRIWCPINTAYCFEFLCHETGHYLFGFLDEYASAIGFYGFQNNLWEGGDFYSYDYTDASGNGAPNKIIETFEKQAAYWNKHCTNVVPTGVIDRPSDDIENFGLMDIQFANDEAIEMSRAATYEGVVSRIYNYGALTQEQIKTYTPQYFYSNASCEEKMAHELNLIANKYAFFTNYSYASQMQRSDYWYAGDDNVTIKGSYFNTEDQTSLNGSVPKQFNSGTEVHDIIPGCEFNYEASVLNISSQAAMDVTITDFDGTVVFSASLDEGNNYIASFEPAVESCLYVTTNQILNGEIVTKQYFLESLSVDSDFKFNNESPTVSLFSKNETQAVVLHDSETITNGDYSSVIGEYNIISNSASETTGTLQTSLSFDLDIDYSSLTWFYMADSEWVALETTHSTDDHCNPNFSCDFAGNGKYCLMAKTAGTETLSTPTNITVTSEGHTADGEVLIQFTDNNTDVLNYNIYYSKEPITSENYTSAESVVVPVGSNQAYITVKDVEATYYFVVQTIGKTGAKSAISENVSFACSYTDSDNDGIPDYWLDIYYQLNDLEDIAGTDSDNDGTTNFQEYLNGTNPLNPDTDGDNVCDGVEKKNSLNPIEPMTDGVTDDYTVVYGTPDLKVTNISFDDENIYFNISNETDGKAMCTIVDVTSNGDTIATWSVNVDAQSTIELSVNKTLLDLSSGFEITVDGAQVTRDIDYSNNIFRYAPATSISLNDVTLIKGSSQAIEIICEPTSGNELCNWSVVSGSDNISVNEAGIVSATGIGNGTIKVETLSGLSDTCEITVVPFEGAGYTEFDCELINNGTEVAILGYIGSNSDIKIPDSIGGYPVTQLNANCIPSGISKVTIPATVTNVDSQALVGNTLEYFDVDENNTEYTSVDGILYNKDKSTLVRVPAAYSETSFIITDSVTSICDYAFAYCTNLESITISNSISVIGNNAFDGCQNLSTLILGENINTIGDYAFRDCKNLSKVNLPNNALVIGRYAFAYTGITELVLPENVVSIGTYAFSNCKGLQKVNYNIVDCTIVSNNTLVPLPISPFNGSDNLTTIIIGENVKAIPKHMFYSKGCIKSVYIKDLEKWCNIDFANSYANPLNYAENLYVDGKLVTNIVVPEGTTTINDYAFCNFKGFESITVPKNVTNIGYSAFKDCSNLKYVFYGGSMNDVGYITIGSYNEPLINSYIHYESTDHIYSNEWTIDVPTTCTEDGSKSRHCIYCDKMVDITVVEAMGHSYSDEWTIDIAPTCTEDGSKSHHCVGCEDKKDVTVIAATGHIFVNEICCDCGLSDVWVYELHDEYAVIMSYSGNKSDVVIPNSIVGLPVTKIAEEAFLGYTTLTSVVIPDSITTIGLYAFEGCQNLKSITIPESVTLIEQGAFQYTGLSTVFIPRNTTVESMAFAECLNLQEITVDIGNPYYTTVDGVLFNKDITRLIQFPAGKSDIYCSIPDSVTIIENGAFGACLNLNSVDISGNVSEIGYNAFQFCLNLKEINLSENLMIIHSGAFANCQSLETITIPESVELIEGNSFMECINLQYIFILNDDITLRDYSYTFDNCDKLNIVANKGSTAETFAKNNNVNFIPNVIKTTGAFGSKIDYINKTITFDRLNVAQQENSFAFEYENEWLPIFYWENAIVVSANQPYIGTGTEVTVVDEEYGNYTFTCIIKNDVNGDGVCDALDAAQVANASNGLKALDGAYKTAADSNSDDEISIEDYQAIVNKVVA